MCSKMIPDVPATSTNRGHLPTSAAAGSENGGSSNCDDPMAPDGSSGGAQAQRTMAASSGSRPDDHEREEMINVNGRARSWYELVIAVDLGLDESAHATVRPGNDEGIDVLDFAEAKVAG